MRPATSARTSGLITSDIRRVTAECLRLGALNLGQGLSDLAIPSAVTEATKAAVDAGHNAYSPPAGIPHLRAAIAEHMREAGGLDADPDSEITVTAGSAGAFSATITAVFDAGDQVIVFEPFYPYHLNQLVIAGLEPIVVPLQPPDFGVDGDALRQAIGPRVRGIVVCTPTNPSGKVFTDQELTQIVRIAAEHDLLVVADEVYEEFRYDGVPHVSMATLPDARGRTITISGASKNFHITGWRIGWVTAPAAISTAIRAVNDLLCVCAPTPLQHGVAAGLRLPPEYFDGLRRSYQTKRDILCEALDAADLNPIVPRGSYFLLADVTGRGYANAATAADDLIRHAGVGAVPATSFYRGPAGDTQLRFCFAKTDELLTEAARRLTAIPATASRSPR